MYNLGLRVEGLGFRLMEKQLDEKMEDESELEFYRAVHPYEQSIYPGWDPGEVLGQITTITVTTNNK